MIPPLRHLFVTTTIRCNLACPHCWIDAQSTMSEHESDQMDINPNRFDSILEEACEQGLKTVKFTGGEPLLHPKFPELFGAAIRRGLLVDIETNGTAGTEIFERAINLAKPRSISVSIDSSDPNQHDEFRRSPGSWRKAVRFCKTLESAGISYGVVSTAISLNTKAISDLAKFVFNRGANYLKINPVTPMGRGLLLDRKIPDLEKRLSFVREIHSRFGPEVRVSIPPAFLSLARLKSYTPCPVLNIVGLIPGGRLALCGAGNTNEAMIIGNLDQNSLSELWKQSGFLRRLRSLVPTELKGICSKCILNGICKGYCLASNYVANNRLNGSNRICTEAYQRGLFPETRMIDG
ncbi:radical SAM protein [Candidatus Fermentibacteria bacterium]|nr:radical SAM protein [Candidatus Fermentibacteria bacterium]